MSPQAIRLRKALLARGFKVPVRTQGGVAVRGIPEEAISGLFPIDDEIDLRALAAEIEGTVFLLPHANRAWLDSRWQPGGRVVEVAWPDPKGSPEYREAATTPFKQYFCETHDRVYQCADCMDELLVGAEPVTEVAPPPVEVADGSPCSRCGGPTKVGKQWIIGGERPLVYCSRECLHSAFEEQAEEARRAREEAPS